MIEEKLIAHALKLEKAYMDASQELSLIISGRVRALTVLPNVSVNSLLLIREATDIFLSLVMHNCLDQVVPSVSRLPRERFERPRTETTRMLLYKPLLFS